jgi:hypothetical protein
LTYDQQILSILTEAGERGISVKSICKHVYNMNCTFFVQPDFDEIRTYVRNYLFRNSRTPQSLVKSTGRRGYYRLNTTGSPDALQMLLRFREDRQEEEDEKPQQASPTQQDLSLDLFDF